MYPENDHQYEEIKVKSVQALEKKGWAITRDDGFSFFVPPESQIIPEAGMLARFYGDGIGRPVRGLFLDGIEVFYKNNYDFERQQEIDHYGADAADWLKRWDKGETVWSIEMGGLGPGYEQCIHITCAEILRQMINGKYDHSKWSDTEIWKHDRDEIEKAVFENEGVKALGLSGAQWGAALSLASFLYKDGPIAVMKDDRVKDRHIQVSKNFPH